MHKKTCIALAAAGLALAGALAYSRGISGDLSFGENCRYLSDGFFVAGMAILSVGVLMWVTTTGFFDLLTYSVRFGLHALIGFIAPERRKPRQGFLEYKLERDAARKKGRSAPLLVIGAIWIALAGVFLILYYKL